MTLQSSAPSSVKRAMLASAVAAGLAGLVAVLSEYGHRQITQAYRNDFRDDPARWGLDPAEEIDLTTRDGIKLHAWLFAAPEAVASVVVLHGHGASKHYSLPIGQFLYPRFNVLMLDHRGHGESDGPRTTIGYEERLDVHAAVDLLISRGLGPVGIFGTSMGASTAILAAAEDTRIAAIVADSPYAKLRWAVSQGAVLRGYPRFVAPAMATLGCWATALHLRSPMQAFDPVEVVDRISPRPLFLLHGTEDDIIPVESAHALIERAGEPKELWLIEGLKHVQGLELAYETFTARVLAFFERWLVGHEAGVPAWCIGAPDADGMQLAAES
jgi:fermentation-respiration switch protein FrsA (DUF1100 family)